MRKMIWVVLLVGCGSAPEQPDDGPRLMMQLRDGDRVVELPAEERAKLGDAFFNLVLRDHVDVTDLNAIEDLIQPVRENRHTFVVSENIADPSRGQVRRAVLSYSGSNRGEVLTANIMISVFFGSQAFEPRAIEAWGWDAKRARYNYYKFDDDSWKFRGSSVDADLLTGDRRRNTCLACHINGGPVMKELSRPWNNWDSFDSKATYLNAASPENLRWPVSESPFLRRLNGAEKLEVDGILPSISQFNRTRIEAMLEGTGVRDARRLLRPLFQDTEVNLISAVQKSGLHPLSKSERLGPGEAIRIPNTFFLNANLIGGGTPAGYKGLGIRKSQTFSQFAVVQPDEYRQLIEDEETRLAGKLGDADFAWFVPERSHIDNDFVDRLLKRGVLSAKFIAAVLSIDLETPVFSEKRAALFRFVPKAFRNSEDLTRKMITAIEAEAPAEGTPAAALLERLRSADPVDDLKKQIEAYIDRVRKRLEDEETREEELLRLFHNCVQRRKQMLRDPVLRRLDETGGDRLLPVP